MRIFLLPLTTRQALIYCQKPAQQATKPASYSDRIINFAAKTWAKWEAAEKGWQKTVVKYGNRGLQRVPYPEWGLKSFPPGTPKAEAQTLTDAVRHDVVYPGNVMHKDDVPKVMLRLARERRNLHWNRFIGSMLGMPLTAPFMLVPVYGNGHLIWRYALTTLEYPTFRSFILPSVAGPTGEVRARTLLHTDTADMA